MPDGGCTLICPADGEYPNRYFGVSATIWRIGRGSPSEPNATPNPSALGSSERVDFGFSAGLLRSGACRASWKAVRATPYLQLREGGSAWDSLMPRTRAATMFMTPCRRDVLPQTMRTGARISWRYFSNTAGHETTGECPVLVFECKGDGVGGGMLATNHRATDRHAPLRQPACCPVHHEMWPRNRLVI